jgi:hypothetical protein
LTKHKPKTLTKRKPKGINPRTRWAIRGYVKQGYSANKIQRSLKAQHLGIRRTVLLVEIRKAKHRKAKANRFKYTPKKYRYPARQRRRAFGGREVAVYGYARTHENPRAYSARFEFSGSGKDCQRAVVKVYNEGWVPRKEDAFVRCSAKRFLRNPEEYAEEGAWSGKPDVES